MLVGSLRVDLDDAELVGERDRLADRGDGRRAPEAMCASIIWPKSMRYTWSAPTTTTMSGFSSWMQVEALQDRVGRAAEPALAEALLRRHRGDVGVQQAATCARSARRGGRGCATCTG